VVEVDDVDDKTRTLRPALIMLALAFLFEVWVWDHLVAAIRWILDQIPWAEFRRRGRAQFNRWPAIVSVLTFGVPFLIVEGGCTVSVILVALGHILLGTLLYISLKILLLTMVALIFDLTKERLMTLAWFVFIHEKLIAFHHYAGEIVAPYREVALRVLRAFRGRARAWRRRFMIQLRAGRSAAVSEIDAD
jgi:hypothetical protein